MRNLKGFTLLELIIVIIIISVLASLALPRLFNVIEYSRISEALSVMSSLRRAVEACTLMHDGSNAKCRGGYWLGGFGGALGLYPLMPDADPETFNPMAGVPFNPPQSHFEYSVNGRIGYGCTWEGECSYDMCAMRNTKNGGAPNFTDGICYHAYIGSNSPFTNWCGRGVWENYGIGRCSDLVWSGTD